VASSIPIDIQPKNNIQSKITVKYHDSLQKIKPFNYTEISFGTQQKYPRAPFEVPVGFTTQIPYNTGINATVLINPCPIPITNMWSIVMSDPVVFGSMLYLITSIISRIGDYCNRSSVETQKIVRQTIKRIGKRKLLQGLLTSLWAGFADIRLNWEQIDGIDQINSIQILPQNSILLCVTPEGELDPQTGVIQYYYNTNSTLNNFFAQNSIGNAPFAQFGSPMVPHRQMAINALYGTALPSDYVLHHVNNPIGLEGNLCGTSMIQSIYSSIVNKANQLERMAIASTYKASPMILFYTDTNTTVDFGDGTFGSMKQNVASTIDQGLASGVYIIEGKNAVEHHVVDNTADLEKMASLVYLYNDEIRTGLVTPNLVGNSGSYANATANNEANSDIIDYLTQEVIRTLEEQLVPKIIKHSVDDMDKVEDTGYFELLDNSLEERAIWGKVLEMSKNLGVINPKSIDDYNLIRKKLGYKAVDDFEDDALMHFMQAMTEPENSHGVDVNKTKQDVGKKYANGGAKAINKEKYSA
jgi:hypothetical protein